MEVEFKNSCDSFINSWNDRNLNKCEEELKKIKLLSCMANIDPCNYSPDKIHLFILMRTIYEICLKISFIKRDASSFVRYMKPLKSFYFDLADVLPVSEQFESIFGLNLMHLIASNSINDFHDDLERIPFTMLTNCNFVRVPLTLEQVYASSNS
uniref:26S proteasome non-ATPase regulatory subunit 8 (Trinotate prediction) n=1 Tax=Henneguya salminicola TaxID=69463 RepID=A0A6G3MGB8_HENSL